MGRRQGEEHHSPCQQIQAASLILEGLPIHPQYQTSDPALHEVLRNC